MSRDGTAFQVVETRVLEDRRGEDKCKIPIETISVERNARFVRIHLLSWYGEGNGLHYVELVGYPQDQCKKCSLENEKDFKR